jgi:hypothetical protein
VAFKNSLVDKLSNALAPKMRALKDINVKLLGTKTKVMRIKQEEMNLLGDITYSYQSDVIDNVIIQYPFNQVEIFGNADSTENTVNSIDFYDLLPVNLFTYFDKPYVSGASQIDRNDIIVDVLWDEHGTGIPIVFKVSRQFSSFFQKVLISKKYEMTLQRGNIEPEIQNIIDLYIQNQIYTSGQL